MPLEDRTAVLGYADTGTEAPPSKLEETDDSRYLVDARDGVPTLFRIGSRAVAEYVQRRWQRLETVARKRLAEIKVNYLRYDGQSSFVQVHPSDPSRVYIPPGERTRAAPTINKIKRTVQRYVAQITADEPVMEGVPASHRDEDRDAAEAATVAIRGEWQRMGLTRELQRSQQISAVMRSAFWFWQWDSMDGTEEPAHKFFTDDKGQEVLMPVDSSGKPVDDVSKAARIRPGNMKVSVMTPANVRWEGSRYAHDAKEVMVAEILTLRELYEMDPASRKVKISEILPRGDHTPTSGVQWLQSIRAETPEKARRNYSDELLSSTGENISEIESILDEPVQVTHYYLRPGRTYRRGFYALVVGKHMLHRGKLRYGIIPVAHFKFLDEIGDPMGLGLVDLLKEPQELLNFVNSQILRYLQMLKRRWFVPIHSAVNEADLLSPAQSIIYYNAQGGAEPKPENQPDIPNSLVNWTDRFNEEFNDQSGIHDTLQGKHVPGVSSGRHAEALRSGDETLLGLTREQMKEGLQAASKIMLAIMKREWKMERRVRFLGEDRQYVDRAFKSVDFGQTGQVVLKNSTLLMLTPAQRLDTIMAYQESGIFDEQEVRQLAPLGDVMGVSLSEDVHYQRARRQSARFLEGPPDELQKAREIYEMRMQALEREQADLERAVAFGMDPASTEAAAAAVEQSAMVIEEEWQIMLEKYAFEHMSWEDRPDISRIHAMVHADSLAADKVERFPDYWVELMNAHCSLETQLGFAEEIGQAAMFAGQAAAAGLGQPQGSPPAPVDSGATGVSPAGLSFPSDSPNVVDGAAP